MKKATRTISGVTPVAVMTKPIKCPGGCIYCPTFKDTPQSYTPESPAVLRGIKCGYNAQKQVAIRLKILSDMGHPVDKVELIIMGGTFLATPLEYQYEFIKGCYDALNRQESDSLNGAQKINETAAIRCVGLCIETRPDWCGEDEVLRMLEFGTTRIELGVQTIDEDIYRLVMRGHKTDDVIRATRLLREQGLKVHYHWMPGLPGSTPEKDLAMTRELFANDNYKPDGLKLYPTMVVEGTELEEWYKDGRYKPYSKETMVNLITDIKLSVPEYVRISRVLRDIPAKYIVAGLKDSMRDNVKKRMEEKAIECKCIRCREYGHRLINDYRIGKPELKRTDYQASGGREIFLSLVDSNNTLFGLLRMRMQENPPLKLKSLRGDSFALVRELHIYGQEVAIGDKQIEAAQHKGLGKYMLAEAERIAGDEYGVSKIIVLSGVGARQYYSSEAGYRQESGYMVKEI